MANVIPSERVDQVESFSFVGRLKVQTTPVAALCYELADDTCASGTRNMSAQIIPFLSHCGPIDNETDNSTNNNTRKVDEITQRG